MPLLVGAILVLFPFFALLDGSPGKDLFENLFLLDWISTFVTTAAASLLSWSLLLTGRLVGLNGQERFGVVQWLTANRLSGTAVFLALLLVVPMIAGQFLKNAQFQLSPTEIRWKIFGCVLGFVSAYLVAFLALVGAVFISPQGTQMFAASFPGPPFLTNLFRLANRHSIFRSEWWQKIGQWCLQHLPEGLQAGYLDRRPRVPDEHGHEVDNVGYGLPWSGQWLVFTFAVSTFVVYYAIDIYKEAHLGERTSIPALAFVILLLLNLNWVFAMAAFFLDRFRIPLVIPLIVLSIFGTHAPSSDHYYQVQPGVLVQPITPYGALEKRIAAHKPIIVIATAGGGIQAAAWTMRVLTGLESESLQWGGSNNFADSIALISSVSGGAAGALFFLNEYAATPERPGFQLADRGDNFSKLVGMACESSLDDVAWGLVYKDIPRILTPYGTSGEDLLLDRGRMLELSWQSRSHIFASLSNWRQGVAEGWRPAAIFNSTITETGEPLLFSTTDLRPGNPKVVDPAAERPTLRTFNDEYPNVDIPVVTAARLAAAFPFVSPAARARTDQPEYHLIDGGYYDNYGVESVIEWIDQALEERKRTQPGQPLPPILILQIRSFPADSRPQPQNRGWFFQAHAPLDGLLNARTAAQLIRDRQELQLLRKRWNPDSKDGLPVIRFAGFEFKAPGAPLSWKMNQSQINALDTQWAARQTDSQEDFQQIRCMFDPARPECAKLARYKDPW